MSQTVISIPTPTEVLSKQLSAIEHAVEDISSRLVSGERVFHVNDGLAHGIVSRFKSAGWFADAHSDGYGKTRITFRETEDRRN